MGILTVVLWYGGHLVILKQVDSGLLVSFLLYQFQLGENLRVNFDFYYPKLFDKITTFIASAII